MLHRKGRRKAAFPFAGSDFQFQGPLNPPVRPLPARRTGGAAGTAIAIGAGRVP
jgi:hypothetical protein